MHYQPTDIGKKKIDVYWQKNRYISMKQKRDPQTTHTNTIN